MLLPLYLYFQYLHVHHVLSKEVKRSDKEWSIWTFIYSVCSHEGHSRNRPIAVIDKTYACMHVQQSLCHFNLHVLISKIYRMIFHCKILLVGNQLIAYKSFAKKINLTVTWILNFLIRGKYNLSKFHNFSVYIYPVKSKFTI